MRVNHVLLAVSSIAMYGFWVSGGMQHQEPIKSISLTSPAFSHAGPIPIVHTCDGEKLNFSPPLQWEMGPEDTKSYALICEDPDAEKVVGYTWIHWVFFNLPGYITSLSEGAMIQQYDAVEGRTSSLGTIGYSGPCPPPGDEHRYFFRLYALDTLLNLGTNATAQDVKKSMQGHILAEGELMGRYQRK